MEKDDRVAVSKTVKGRLPRLPFIQIKNVILGKRYVLSIVFIGEKRSRNLNKKYRRRDKPANVLGFPISGSEGEIFINPHKAKRDASLFKMSYTSFMAYLLIHGMLHLKGLRHGSKMKRVENKLIKSLNLN